MESESLDGWRWRIAWTLIEVILCGIFYSKNFVINNFFTVIFFSKQIFYIKISFGLLLPELFPKNKIGDHGRNYFSIPTDIFTFITVLFFSETKKFW